MGILLEVGQTDVTVPVLVGAGLLLLKWVMIACRSIVIISHVHCIVTNILTSPAVASVGAGGGQPHVGLAVGRGQGVAEQLGGVESAPGGVGGAAPGDGGGPGV